MELLEEILALVREQGRIRTQNSISEAGRIGSFPRRMYELRKAIEGMGGKLHVGPRGGFKVPLTIELGQGIAAKRI